MGLFRPTPRYGHTRTYVVFNPRFEQDPTWQEFVIRADDNNNTLLTEINWRDNPWFPDSLERQRQRSLLGDAGDIIGYGKVNFYRLAMRQSWPKVKKFKTLRQQPRWVHLISA